MEYKYFLEVLKNGLYEEFFEDFNKCGVCFFSAEKYGRNILENSSFIVSSAYPDKNLWAKGFVARLSGATVELLNIWMLLCLGKKPFFVDAENSLCMRFSPILKQQWFTLKPENINFQGKEITFPANTFTFTLFSSILVTYHNPQRKDTFKKDCRIEKIVVSQYGKKHVISSDIIKLPLAQAVRDKEVQAVDVYFA